MRKSITVQVTTVAGAEVLVDALTGLAEKKRRVIKIHCEQGVDLRLRVYKDQERIMDTAVECEDFDTNGIECDIPLEAGNMLKVGYQSDGATAAAHYATVDFEEN